MTPAAFFALEFHQHMCLQDPDLLADLRCEGIPAVRAGYYELICGDIRPAASIGCAWYVTAGCVDIKVGKFDVSSNIMLLDANGDDYGAQYSCTIIRNWLCSGARQLDLVSAIIMNIGVRRRI